jgi:SRSO17 transposase
LFRRKTYSGVVIIGRHLSIRLGNKRYPPFASLTKDIECHFRLFVAAGRLLVLTTCQKRHDEQGLFHRSLSATTVKTYSDKNVHAKTISLSVGTWNASLPIAWRLYLPEAWCQDSERRQTTGIPEGIDFQTKPAIALAQIRQAREQSVPVGVVLADAAYGNGTQFRAGISELGLQYAVAIESSTTVWEPGQRPLPAPPPKPGRGAPPKRLQRNANHLPVSAKQLALGLPSSAWKDIGWRQGSKGTLRSRFAAVRVRPAHRDYKRTEPHAEEWLLIEWPKNESEPAKYWLSTLPDRTALKSLVKIAKQRWIIERDYEELKQELGLGHYEGRGWRGFHHHATLCIAAYGFLVSERSRFSPSVRVGHIGLRAPRLPGTFRPRGSPHTPRAA